MTVVLDCNILVISLTSRSPYHKIYQSLVAGRFDLIVTNDIVLEYYEIIERKYGKTTADAFTALLTQLPNVHFIDIYYRWNLIDADPDDNKYCDCAVAGQADYIVTEDNHFSILQTIAFPPLQAIGIDYFSTII